MSITEPQLLAFICEVDEQHRDGMAALPAPIADFYHSSAGGSSLRLDPGRRSASR